jgi:cation transport ATPase
MPVLERRHSQSGSQNPTHARLEPTQIKCHVNNKKSEWKPFPIWYTRSTSRNTTMQTIDSDHAHEHEQNRLVASMDTLGIAASSLCVVHCLAMPLVIGVLPLLGLQFLEGHNAHVVLAAFVLSFALLAIVPGYLRHRRKDILGMMLIGLSFVLYATFVAQQTLGESWEIPLITIGNLILVGTHFRNRALHRCPIHK